VVDRADPRRAACVNFVLQVVGFALLLWGPSVAALYAGCIVVGLGVGNMVSLPGLLVGREFPREQFAGVVSLVTATNQVAFAFAPALMGILRDATGSYGFALGLCLGLDAMAAGVVLMGAVEPRPGVTPAAAPTQLRVLRDRDCGPESREAFICSWSARSAGIARRGRSGRAHAAASRSAARSVPSISWPGFRPRPGGSSPEVSAPCGRGRWA
jgi:MFS family permease